VNNIDDVTDVIRQIKPIELSAEQASRFGLPIRSNLQDRLLAFAYFLGVMLGDMSKARGKNRRNMQVLLKLSMHRQTNLRFGEYVATCAGFLGIRMHRIKDCIRHHPQDKSTFGAYVWTSQTSEFLLWMFEKCLGLRQGETTTRNPIRAPWILRMPRQFQICFLQGLADSDGYVDLNKHEVGLVVEPNQALIGRLLKQLHVHFRESTAKHQATVLLSVKEAFAMPIFSPISRTHRFELASRLAHAQRLQGAWPTWLRAEVDELSSRGDRTGKIVLFILDKYGIAIRSQHIRKPIRSSMENSGVPGAGRS